MYLCFIKALVAQWLRLCAPNAGGLSLSPHVATKSSQAATKTQYSQIHKEIKTLKKGISKAGEQFLCLITITLSSMFTQSLRGQSTIMFFAGKFYFCSELLLNLTTSENLTTQLHYLPLSSLTETFHTM